MIRGICSRRQIWRLPVFSHVHHSVRCMLSSDTPVELTQGEKKLIDILRSKFPGAKSVQVSDISGGCGAMYQISVEATEFRGKRTVQQHRMINEALADEIKEMHGLQINTKAPDT